MVKLTKIYTRTGDDGTTGLGTAQRVAKDSARVEAYGDVDEANAAIGVAIASAAPGRSAEAAIATLLRSVQQDLFDLGADLCIPVAAGERPGEKLRVQPGQTARLEEAIDEHNAGLGTLTSFVLPGGSALAAALHVARTVMRRAERRVVTLVRAEPAATNPETVRYLNRLSDLLFVLARAANRAGEAGAGGAGDILWVPGANRAGARRNEERAASSSTKPSPAGPRPRDPTP
ncbi:MAG: cob(I)yrinic acid a,c-diamide adenosyltransferase [Phycisphaerales bacterium]